MIKKRILVVSALALMLVGTVSAHKEAVEEEEIVATQTESAQIEDSEFIENLHISPIGSEVYTGPKDFTYCKPFQKI